MDIDLFTWLAQIVNFLILMGLLRYFLYGRIIGAIDAREEKIASRWRDAEQERDKASEEAQSYAARREELEGKQNDILAQAREDAERQKQQWLQEARAEVNRARDNWHESLEKQQQSFAGDLRRAATQEITRAVRKVLRDLADEDLERQALEQFTKQLTRSQEQTKELKDFIQHAGSSLAVNTAFGLSKEQQERLRSAINRAADTEVNLRFDTSEGLLCGVELRADGRKMGWSIDGYLDGLEERMNEMLERRVQHGAAPVPEKPEQQADEENRHGEG